MTTEVLTPRTSSALTRVACVLAFWLAGAALVVLAHQALAASPVMSVAAKVIAIIVAAGAYMRIAARHATLDHALAVGVIWLVLAIIAEVIASQHSGRAWFDLIGSPDSALRNVLLIAWVVAPALFAKSAE